MTAAAAEALTDGLALHQSGQLDEAESRYGEAVEAEPANADAWHLLGHIAIARRDWKSAAARVLQAIRLQPEAPGFPQHPGRHSGCPESTTAGHPMLPQGAAPRAGLCAGAGESGKRPAKPGALPRGFGGVLEGDSGTARMCRGLQQSGQLAARRGDERGSLGMLPARRFGCGPATRRWP